MKQLICYETNDEITIDWEDLLFHLRSLAQEKEAEYKIQTARLVAMIGVHRVLKQIEKEEDQKLLTEINKPQVRSLLKNITGSYDLIEIIDEDIYVNDPYSQYPLSATQHWSQGTDIVSTQVRYGCQLDKRRSTLPDPG